MTKFDPDNIFADYVYIISGFRRSGNHFLITLILSNFNDNEVLYLANPFKHHYIKGKIA